jgi:hypothetical protein
MDLLHQVLQLLRAVHCCHCHSTDTAVFFPAQPNLEAAAGRDSSKQPLLSAKRASKMNTLYYF